MSLKTLPQTEALERVLESLAAEHESLIALARGHREALRKADSPAIARIATLRAEANERIVELDRERARLVDEIAKSLGLPSVNLTVRALIARLGGPSAARLSALAQRLRSLIEEARQEQSALREATATLAGHLGGLLAQVAQTCAVARTYTARGRMAQGIALPAAMDIRH